MSEEKIRIHARILPNSNNTSEAPRKAAQGKKKNSPQKLTRTDRLLRNSALACALLLAVLSVGNIDRPWARSISRSVEQALTMHIDLDESLGQLTFVKNWMPESALVFFNLSGRHALETPVQGRLTHRYSEDQPWLLFQCDNGSDVRCAKEGVVTAVSPMSGDTFGILVDHGGGQESVYAYLNHADVSGGDCVTRGQKLGKSGENVYFELRENEKVVDPSEMMGL